MISENNTQDPQEPIGQKKDELTTLDTKTKDNNKKEDQPVDKIH